MSVRDVLSFALLTLAFAAATGLGWWMVPGVAALWGALRPSGTYPAGRAALAASLAWAAWLLWTGLASGGALGVLTGQLEALLRLPGPALWVLTVVFPAPFAWAAATLAQGVAERAFPVKDISRRGGDA